MRAFVSWSIVPRQDAGQLIIMPTIGKALIPYSKLAKPH